MLTKSRSFAGAALAGGVLALAACGGGSSSSSPSSSPGASSSVTTPGSPTADASADASAFAQSLDKLCAANWAVSQSLPSLQANQHLTAAQLQAKVKAAAQAFVAGKARLVPPLGLAAALNTLNQDAAKVPASPTSSDTTELAKWTTAMITYETRLASDYTALGATGCASDEQQSLVGLEDDAKRLTSPSS